MSYRWAEDEGFVPGPFADKVLEAGKLVEKSLNPVEGKPEVAYILIAYQSPKVWKLAELQMVTNIIDKDHYKGVLAQIGVACGG
jgi:hypothetical protein